MNAFIFVIAAVVAVAQGGVIAHTGTITHSFVAPVVESTHIQGPGSSAHIVGPDGSEIIASAPGAKVITSDHAVAHAAPAVVAHHDVVIPNTEVVAPVIAAYSAPVVAHHAVDTVVSHQSSVINHGVAHHAVAAPVLAHHAVATPVVAYSAPVVAHQAVVAPAVAYAAPIVGPSVQALVAHQHVAAPVVGPSVQALVAPAVAHHSAPVVAYSAPVVAHHSAPVVVPAVSVAHHGLVASPIKAHGYPLFAAGSGIEGQYAHDYTDKFFDDGSYKGEFVH